MGCCRSSSIVAYPPMLPEEKLSASSFSNWDLIIPYLTSIEQYQFSLVCRKFFLILYPPCPDSPIHKHIPSFETEAVQSLKTSIDTITREELFEEKIYDIMSPIPYEGDGTPFLSASASMVSNSYSRAYTPHWILTGRGLDEDFPMRSKIFDAVVQGDFKSLQNLLGQNLSYGENYFNLESKKGQEQASITILCIACASGSCEIVKELLNKTDIDINRGFIVERIIIEEGIKYLNGAIKKYSKEIPPLHIAASKGYWKIVEELLRRGAQKDFYGLETDNNSIMSKHTDYGDDVLTLTVNGKKGESINLPLDHVEKSEEKNYLKTFEILLKSGVEKRLIGFECIGDIDLLSIYIKEGGDVNISNSEKFTLLEYSLQSNQISDANLLIENGALITQRCLICSPESSLNMFIDKFKGPPSIPYTAVKYNSLNLLRYIKKTSCLKIDLKEVCNDFPILHLAAHNKSIEILEFIHDNTEENEFIEAINYDINGYPPLWFALPSLTIIEKMLEYGAEIKLLSFSKVFRTYPKREDLLKFLISKGIDMDEKDSSGHTALSHAVKDNRIDLAQLLIKLNANFKNNYLG